MFSKTWAAIRGNLQQLAAAGAVGLSVAIMYPHFWGLKRYRNFMQMQKDGEPVPVDADTMRLGQQVFDKVLWDPGREANVDFFTVYGQDIVHKGSTFMSYGALVGVPVNFRYRQPEDVDTDKITLNNTLIDWSSPGGKQLMNSMILSEKARQFAVARELFYLNTHHVFVRVGFLGVSFFLAYWLGAATNSIYRLSKRLPVGQRAVIYGFFTGMGATMYLFATDNYNWYRDRKADRLAAELGIEYAEGGVEFYDNLLKRNMALRTLMGPEGNKRYTAYGNDVHFWRSPNVPLTARKDTLLEKVKEMQGSVPSQISVETAAHS